MQKTDIRFPLAEKIAQSLSIHEDDRVDDYFWLRDRENPKVVEYLNAENTFRESEMKDTEELQENLFQEIKGRIKQDDASVPYHKNGYWYYVRFEEGKEHAIYCRKKGQLSADEEIMMDVNIEAAKHSYYQVAGMSVSPDNKLLAFGEDKVSRRIYTLRFKNLETGEILEDEITNTTGGAAWANDNSTIFYTAKDETLRPNKVYRHKLGSKTDDVEIYHEADETFVCGAYRSKSQSFIMIASGSTVSNEYRYLDANNPEGEFKIIQPRVRDLEYSVAHFGEFWYILTNADKATNFKLMRAPLAKTTKENWEEIIPHRPNVYLENLEIFKEYLVTEERENGLTRIRIKRWDGSDEHYMEFDEETYTAGIGNNPEFDSQTLRYGYSSLTTPSSVIDYDMEFRKKQVMKQQEVVGGHNPEEYHAERIWATAADGTKVPMSLVYKKSLKKAEGNPTLLYGYGSYGITVDPGFSATRLSLLDRGFVFVIAHIRGGQYLGRQWYEDGKMLKKKNTFTDFIACAEKLIEDKYTTTEHLYAMGGSAGGLLMGAVMNMRPDLFNGMIAAVPFVDVVTTMLDTSIPLTTGEYDEWGNPNDRDYYDYIKSYSPYDNVEEKDYPSLLITTGINDSQVQYWEPAKWVAKLRTKKTDKNPLYLYTNMDTGHSGASGRFEAYRETAMEYAFLLKLEGILK
ncbi:protease II [Owenweeksia hongkongensis DSM 17368]|uniref:Proline-specific endopeptidase n=1 Tax=Owenweeksia hongkongensis (strain DSM 17368 / CIP 108786 / JCM 12287 / NRRL B-23963 / UST20020801) TaxID=926562 RepID=G8R157_OWEHD|nr:oligopeptidase B [Owenweeksia hongkongensis]AEV32772.1 protease II [Owenweeksia hongkongensis DSM 17368]